MGSLEILGALFGGIYVIVVGIFTFGLGLLLIPIPLIFLTVGVFSLISGIKGLQRTPSRSLMLFVAIFQMCLVLMCDVLGFGAGLTAVILLTQPEVKSYFGR